MNKESHSENELHEFQYGLAGEHIRAEVLKQPKMSTRVAAIVARNLDTLLKELKDSGLAMHEVCRSAALGNPGDRDAKALWKYRNPEGSEQRDYISQAPKYIRLVEAIADIKDHPYSGTSSALLRRVFASTPYSPPVSTKGSDASVALKTILDEVVSWIARQIDLAQAYKRFRGGKLSPTGQFELATACLSHLELGYKDEDVKDDEGHPLVVKSESGSRYDLRIREVISLFIGIDHDNMPRPYLAFEKSLVAISPDLEGYLLGAKPYDIWISYDGAHEGERFGELIFESNENKFYLPKEVVAQTVDLDKLSQNLDHVPFSNGHEQSNPVQTAFRDANPKYGSDFLFWAGKGITGREIKTTPVSADSLEHMEALLSDPMGVFTPAGEPHFIMGHQLLFGDGVLSRLIRWFTDQGLEYDTNKNENALLGDDIPNSPMAPAGGWVSVSPTLDSFSWSAADLLWLRCKMFVMLAEKKFLSATTQERAKYNALLQRLRGT